MPPVFFPFCLSVLETSWGTCGKGKKKRGTVWDEPATRRSASGPRKKGMGEKSGSGGAKQRPAAAVRREKAPVDITALAAPHPALWRDRLWQERRNAKRVWTRRQNGRGPGEKTRATQRTVVPLCRLGTHTFSVSGTMSLYLSRSTMAPHSTDGPRWCLFSPLFFPPEWCCALLSRGPTLFPPLGLYEKRWRTFHYRDAPRHPRCRQERFF